MSEENETGIVITSRAAIERPSLLLVGPLELLGQRLAQRYLVLTVPTVRAALTSLLANDYHLVVSAASLPDGDGLEVVAGANAMPESKRPQVVVLSATDHEPFLEATAVALAAVRWFQPTEDSDLKDEDALRLRIVSEAHGRLGDPAFGPAQMAEAVGLSPRQLRRRLAELTGESPGNLLRRLRLERAADLLASGARIKEAGFAAGFGGQSTFRAAFRRHFGITPSDYAQRRSETRDLEADMSEIGRGTSSSERT